MLKETANPLLTQKNFHDFCRLPNLLVSSFGYDFPAGSRSARSTLFRKYYFLLVCMSHLYVFTFVARATQEMIMSDELKLTLMLRMISGFNYGLFATVKCVVFIKNMDKYIKILENLREIYPKTRNEKLIYRVRNYFWPKWILLVIYFYLGAVAIIVFSPLVETIVFYIVDGVKFGWMQSQFRYYKLYEIEYAFDHRSGFSYLITYSTEVMHAHFAIIFNICGDIWLLCFILQLCMHFDYNARSLKNYDPNEREPAKDEIFIAGFVKRHQIILNLGHDLNKSFGPLLLLQLLSIAATLCCAGIYSLTQGFGRELIEYMAFLPSAIGQYFLICYYGQLLVIKSESVAEAAYTNPWYNGSHSYKKSIFIIIMRSQKNVELNALGFQPIDLKAFQMVMGVTYRVFALLKETMF